MKGFNKVDKNEWFNLRDPETSRATWTTVSITEEGEENRSDVIYKGCVRLDARKFFFAERVAQKWNGLPDSLRNQKSINAFKNGYDGWKKNQKELENN